MTTNKKPSSKSAKQAPSMHSRNVHKNGYPMAALCKAHPALSEYVVNAKSGKQSIDFAKPQAVKALNAALLMHYYGLKTWDIPLGYLCPPVPGRADYIHGIADILAQSNAKALPKESKIRGLDIGTGANAIYPIIGSYTYGWEFVGSDIDAVSVESAELLAAKNPTLTPLFSVRKQTDKSKIFGNIIQPNEHFTFTMCNPPFHKSAKDAALGSERKAKGLKDNKHKRNGKKQTQNKGTNSALNFAGTHNELWCEGGELAFIQRMIIESVQFKQQVVWFTCLVSKGEHLKAIETSLKYYNVNEYKIVNMAQGQKLSRFVAWTFMSV